MLGKIANRSFPGTLILGACLALLPIQIASAAPNPVLSSKNYAANGVSEPDEDLRLKTLDIRINVTGGFAETRIISEFFNPANAILEGNFTLDMPKGAKLVGYGLDIDGEIRDGVIVEKKQGERAFNDRIRRGVDPGLAEITRTNAFTTRVFPILPQQTRTISVTFVSPVSETSPYRLPLESAYEPERVSLMISGDISPETLSLPGKFVPNWSEDGKSAQLVAESLPLDGILTVSPKSTPEMSLTRHSNGRTLLSFALPPGDVRPLSMGTMRVLWDTSLSQKSHAPAALSFLTQLIDRNRPYSIELIPFSDAPAKRLNLRPEADELDHFVTQLTYDGATNLSALFEAQSDQPEADICFLVTDGRTTLGDFPQDKLPCQLHVIAASPEADDGLLGLLARNGGGQYIDLATLSREDAINRLSRAIQTPKRLLIDGRNALQDAEWQDDGDRFRLVVPVSSSSRSYRLDIGNRSLKGPISAGFAIRNDGAGAHWAALRLISERAKGTSREKLINLSREFSISSDETSLLVLETLQDYVEQGLDLPSATFSKTDRQLWANLMENRRDAEKAAKEERLDTVLALWQDQIDWYEGKSPERDVPYGNRGERAMAEAAPPPPVALPSAPPPPVSEMPAQEELRRDEAFDREEIIVTANRAPGPEETNDSENPLGNIFEKSELETSQWSPDRPYLQAATGLCGNQLYAHYLAQRDEYGGVPAYFLEMADLFHRCGNPDRARQIILTALELSSANDDTLTAISFRLIRYGEFDMAIDLLRRVVERDPVRPQPYRNLALALSASSDTRGLSRTDRKARLSEALELLNNVIATPWDFAYEGVELISVIEANRVLAKLRAAGGEGRLPNYNLEYDMPVDIRIVVNWNVDEVDMDLWVHEPGGEVAKYDNPRTRIGGRLSNDMTNGYGPEEYLLKNAPDGSYEIAMDYFSSDVVNPNGAVAVQAEIWRDFGKPSETVERVELEFTDDNEDEYLIATLRVGAR